MYEKFGLVLITACTCITYITGCQEKKDLKKKNRITAPILKTTYDFLETFGGLSNRPQKNLKIKNKKKQSLFAEQIHQLEYIYTMLQT